MILHLGDLCPLCWSKPQRWISMCFWRHSLSIMWSVWISSRLIGRSWKSITDLSSLRCFFLFWFYFLFRSRRFLPSFSISLSVLSVNSYVACKGLDNTRNSNDHPRALRGLLEKCKLKFESSHQLLLLEGRLDWCNFDGLSWVTEDKKGIKNSRGVHPRKQNINVYFYS